MLERTTRIKLYDIMINVTQHITPSRAVSNGVSDVHHSLFALNCDIALEPPTKGILPEASSAGHSNSQPYTLNSHLASCLQSKPEL